MSIMNIFGRKQARRRRFTKQCLFCVFADLKPHPGGWTCRRHPPVLTGMKNKQPVFEFPRIESSWKCGEFISIFDDDQ